ncbi:MAG TPA: ribose 5-phosphate isomerase B [bacterium]
MRIAIASDHGGFPLKQELVPFIRSLGHTVQDLGVHSQEPSDYPDAAEKLGLAIRSGEVDRGLLLCGSGIGAVMAANRMEGIRAGVGHDCYSARQGVEHDDMNVLALGARVIGIELARDAVKAFLAARFVPEERYRRRLGKMEDLGKRYGPGSWEKKEGA